MPKVSIIITTYNRGKELLERCYPSVLNQTYKDYEIIVIEDGTAEVFPQQVPEAKYIRNEVNKGKSWSVNFAVKQAKGQYIVVVDDDNELLPTFLEETVGMIERLPDGTVHDGFYHPKVSAIQVGRIIKHSGFEDYAPPVWHKGYDFSSIDWGWLIRKEVFDEIQYDENIFGDEDADFGIQFFKKFNSNPLNKPLCIAYAEGEGVCTPTTKRLESLIRFYEKNWIEYEKAGPKDLGFLERYIARTFYLGGHKDVAIRHFWKAFRAYPKTRTLIHFLVSLINYKAYYQLMRLEEKYYARKRMAMQVVANFRRA